MGSDEVVSNAVDKLRPKFTPDDYNFFFNNCQDFVQGVDDIVNPPKDFDPRNVMNYW